MLELKVVGTFEAFGFANSSFSRNPGIAVTISCSGTNNRQCVDTFGHENCPLGKKFWKTAFVGQRAKSNTGWLEANLSSAPSLGFIGSISRNALESFRLRICIVVAGFVRNRSKPQVAAADPVSHETNYKPHLGVDSMNERTYCMLLHFSVFAGCAAPLAGLIVPIVLWQLKKNEMPSVDEHGKMVMNFILSSLLYGVVFFALSFAIIGLPLMIALSIACVVLPIIGGIKASEGILWQYPLIINFVK